MNAPDMEDADAHAMRRLAQGQDAALDEIMSRHGEKLFRYLLRCLRDEDDAADLAQETFVKLYLHRERFDPRQRFSTWLYTIASNLVKDRYRWRARHPEVSLDAENAISGEPLGHSLPKDDPSPPDQLSARERAETVSRAVAALPEELRLPLVLATYEERSHAEIGAILGCTPKAVETRIYRARQHLRTSLAPLLERSLA
jgi:RNA polymerase sigma-70 factor (ECF subfamily)